MVKFCVRLVVLFCFLLSPGVALAEGFALYEWGARGMALGGAMMGRQPDPSAVAYNAALLTRLPGKQAMVGITGVRPTGRFDKADPPQGGEMATTNLNTNIWSIPHLFYTHQISDDWYFGLGAFTRFGLGLNYPSEWPGRFNVRNVELMTASLNPSIAWKATNKLSFGGGVELMYVTLDLKRRNLVPLDPALGAQTLFLAGTNMEVDAAITDAQGWGIGGNLAVHYQFNDQWAVGIQYRSKVRVRAEGDVKFSNMGLHSGPGVDNSDFTPPAEAVAGGLFNNVFNDGKARSTVTLPDSVSAGISWTPTPDLSIEVGAIWTQWSTFRSLDIEMPGALDTSVNHKRWKDVWRLNAGVEYQALDWLTLRAGYVWDQSPVPNRYQDYLVPTGDRHMGSVGFGFQWGEDNAWTLDFAYAYIKPKNRFYDYRPGNGPGDTNTVKGNTRNMYTQLAAVSLGYRW
jgi:long-chain fatty acid transport protein